MNQDKILKYNEKIKNTTHQNSSKI